MTQDFRGGGLALATAAALIALWLALGQVMPAYLVPSPVRVARTAVQFATEWSYARHALATALHIAASMAAAFALGFTLATAAWFFPVLDVAIHHRLSPFANSFSSVGWTILAVVWLGVGLGTVLFATTLILLPFVLVNLRTGYETLPAEQVEMARSFTRKRLRQVALVILPMLVPYLFASLRIAFGVACQAVLVTELFGGNSGLGYLVNIASQEVDTPLIFAVGLLMVAASLAVDRWLFVPWQARILQTYGPD